MAGRGPVGRSRTDRARCAAPGRLAARPRRQRRDRAPRRGVPRAGERDRDDPPQRGRAPRAGGHRHPHALRHAVPRHVRRPRGGGAPRPAAASPEPRRRRAPRICRRGSPPISAALRPRRASPRPCRPPAPRWYAEASSDSRCNRASATLQAGRRLHAPALLRQPGRGRPRRRRARPATCSASRRGRTCPRRRSSSVRPSRARTTACGSSPRAASCPSPAIRRWAPRTPCSRRASFAAGRSTQECAAGVIRPASRATGGRADRGRGAARGARAAPADAVAEVEHALGARLAAGCVDVVAVGPRG